ncbi:uncharacterized protein LOC141596384 isoform X1 [Silene latifolia]|uniref:uncharacterized protein LOC141596384 isoform X1 n=1 Tax=Silene latifolia TaxID=37657 RepID=UPI003D788C8A
MDDMATDRLANIYNYACGKLVGTVYGPEKYLDEKRRPFCRMNYEEYDNYMKKCDESGGFDVDGCTGRMPGRISPLSKCGYEYEVAEVVAKHAALTQGEAMGIPMELVRLVKANKQPVEGSLYYLTFVAVTTNQMEKTYKAKVWLKPVTWVSEITLFLEETSDGDIDITVKKKVDKPRGRGKITVEENVKFDLSDYFRDTITQPEIRNEIINITNAELQRDDYNLLVKELKVKNPQWKHAKAKKTASRKWKLFRYPQKAPYLKEARRMFQRRYPEYFPFTK